MKALKRIAIVVALLSIAGSASAAFLVPGNGDWFGNIWWDADAGAYVTPTDADDLWIFGGASVSLNDLADPNGICRTLVVGNNDTLGELYIGHPDKGTGGPGALTVSGDGNYFADLRIGYNSSGPGSTVSEGLVSIASDSELIVFGHIWLGEYNNNYDASKTRGTLEIIGSEINIEVKGNFVSGNNDDAGVSSTFSTLRFVPDSGGFSTVNVSGQTYFWPGSIELDIADGPVPMGDYVLISSGSAGSGLGTWIEDMAFALGVNTDRYSFEVIGDELILHVLQPTCLEDLPGDISGDCTVNVVDLALLAKDWLVTVPSN